MKRSTRSFAKASNLSQSIHLNAYALAAVAAVVSVVASAPPSQAKIVYTPADVVLLCHISCGAHYNLDLNHDGVTDFTIQLIGGTLDVCNSSFMVGELPASGNDAIGSGGYAAALTQGAPIGHSQQFQGGEGTMAWSEYVQCVSKHGGAWWNVTDRYLGLSFRRDGRTHYGWARLTVRSAVYAHLTGYA